MRVLRLLLFWFIPNYSRIISTIKIVIRLETIWDMISYSLCDHQAPRHAAMLITFSRWWSYYLVIMLYYVGSTFYGKQEKLFQNLDGTLFKLRSWATQYQLTMDRNNSQNIWTQFCKRSLSTVLMTGHNFSCLPCVISMLHIWSRMKEVNKKKEGLMRDTVCVTQPEHIMVSASLTFHEIN